jgi:uncharacterized protein YegP (UPF0339 family)
VKFQIVHDASRKISWRLVGSNALIIALGVESFETRADCRRAIEFVAGADAKKFRVYRDFQRLWRWHLRSATGNVVAISGETYVTREEALKSAELAARADETTPIEEVQDSGSMRVVRPFGPLDSSSS